MMRRPEVAFEESLSDEWSRDLGFREVPLDRGPLLAALLVVVALVLAVALRIGWLGVVRADYYADRATMNLSRYEKIAAPRGIIRDRAGRVLVDNRPVSTAVLDLKEFLRRPEDQDRVYEIAERILGMSRDAVNEIVATSDIEQGVATVVLADDLTQSQTVALAAEPSPLVRIVGTSKRSYPGGASLGALVGYLGYPDAEDLARYPELDGHEYVGKSGLEALYDSALRGTPGVTVHVRNAKGEVLSVQKRSDPSIGTPLTLTIDGELQEYFYKRFAEGLRVLGRTSGVGLALDPRNGEVLAYLNLPSYDPDVFIARARHSEREAILTSSDRPLFNRAIAGSYNPGSTIKPLVGVAALAENVISPEKQIFSPGYLDVPNPYDPANPTRFVDWRYQGNVDLAAAIAQSSNVYFYEVGGGFGDIAGLGIRRLKEWWQRFALDVPTGIDLPGETKGFLPDAEWKEKAGGRPWLLGDTYNVSIGQGDLLVTPIALVNYIAAIANGGILYRPHVVRTDAPPTVLRDLREFSPAIETVRAGMRQTVRSSMGTAHLMADLPYAVSGKTGSAQVFNKTQENAFFVGYAPADNPTIAILVLVENSKQGSLNAVPIAKDVFAWYYENRLR